MSVNLFKLDGAACAAEIKSEKGQKEIHKALYQEKMKNLINEHVQTSVFQDNPVQFLSEWRLAHPTIKLHSYDRFFSDHHSCCNDMTWEGTAYIQLAKMIISREEYIPTFISWLKEKHFEIIKLHYSETNEDTVKKVAQVFLNMISGPDFEKDLTALRDAIVGKNEGKEFGCLQGIVRGSLEFSEDVVTKNILKFHATGSLGSVIRTYFDFTHSVFPE